MSADDDIERAKRLKSAKNAEAVRRARAAAKATIGGPSVAPRSGLPVNDLIPPDYASFDEAYRRAEFTFGAIEAWPKLRGLLAYGKLLACVVDREGTPQQIVSRFWKSDDGDFDLREGIARASAYTGDGGGVVFSVAELDDLLPWTPTVVEGTATAPAPSAAIGELQLIKNKTKIRGAIMRVWDFAKEHKTAIPNSREMYIYVNKLLALDGARAQRTMVAAIADEMREASEGRPYRAFFCGPGEKPAQKGLKQFADLQFPTD